MKREKRDQEDEEVTPETKKMIEESLKRNKKFLEKLAKH